MVECNLKTTSTLKSNAGDQKVCKTKNLSWLFDADRKIRPSGPLFGITRRSPSDDFFYPHLTPMDDSYTIQPGKHLDTTSADDCMVES